MQLSMADEKMNSSKIKADVSVAVRLVCRAKTLLCRAAGRSRVAPELSFPAPAAVRVNHEIRLVLTSIYTCVINCS